MLGEDTCQICGFNETAFICYNCGEEVCADCCHEDEGTGDMICSECSDQIGY